jgi:hypothetical protein
VSGNCGDNCDTPCTWIFDRIEVFPRTSGGTRVEWTLHPNFSEPLPHDFTLEVGATGLAAADDWQTVGLPARNTFYLVDDQQRVFGHTQWTHYRVRLETPQGVHYSAPVGCQGRLNSRHWRLMRDVIRRELLMLRKESGQEGYILKRRVTGTPCPVCLSFMTDEVTNAQCPTCYGTGFDGGYYPPLGCVWANLTPFGDFEHLDREQTRGSTNQATTRARMLATPQLCTHDVWVDRDSDYRWSIHQVQNIVEMRGIPVVVQVDMQLCPFNDPVYKFPVADLVPAVEYF